MRLKVKQNDSTISEFQFTDGPIYIGRHKNSQIFLGHRAVSRQHAVIFHTEDGKWMVEDLDSANKTYLNNEAVHKAEIKTGDVLRIVDFFIEISLDDDAEASKPIDMEDTLTKTAYDLQAALAAAPEEVLIRQPNEDHAPTIRLPPHRLNDFAYAVEALSKASDLDQLVLRLLDVALQQFDALHSWCALRNRPTGPMIVHGGKERGGRKLDLSQLKLSDRISQAVEKRQSLLVPQVPPDTEGRQKIRSAMIAPVIRPGGCFGVLYVDNDIDRKHYSLSDLDYLMLLCTHAAGVLKRL